MKYRLISIMFILLLFVPTLSSAKGESSGLLIEPYAGYAIGSGDHNNTGANANIVKLPTAIVCTRYRFDRPG